MDTPRKAAGYSEAAARLPKARKGPKGQKGQKIGPQPPRRPGRTQPSTAGSRGGTKILWQLGHCITRVRRMISMYIWGGIRM